MVLEAGAAAIFLLRTTLASSGLSMARLASLIVLGAFLLVGLTWVYRPPTWTDKPIAAIAMSSAGILAIVLAAALFLLRYLEPERLLPYYQRLGLLLGFLLLVATQSFLFLAATRYETGRRAFPYLKPLLATAGIATAMLLLLLIIVSVTRVGLTPDSAYWGETGVPIFGWQLALAILGGSVAALISRRFRQRRALDVVVGIALWALSLVIWLGVPNDVLQNSFYAPIRPPSLQPFPNSDAGYYDSMAQSLLIGYPYQGEIPSRPLYIVTLAALHDLVGERYDLIIVGQTLILALIPVLLYTLGVQLQSRAAGVIAALAAIAREWTTLLVSSDTRVSNTKMLLVDLPTLLLVLAACFFTIRWLRRRTAHHAIVAGGISGMLLLLRTQAAFLIPVAILLAFVVLGGRRRAAYVQVGSFLAAVALTILPWLMHNYVTSGEFSLEAAFQYRIIASQYQYTGNLDIGNVNLQGKNLGGILLEFALADPRFVLGFIANHAMATQIGGILALPLIHEYNGLLADVNLYWMDWNGRLGAANVGLIVLYLSLIGLGMGAAWVRLRWVGIVPLAFSLAYSVANGVARFSGWRYDLPADWVAYFYLAVGIAALVSILTNAFVQVDAQAHPPVEGNIRRATTIWPILALLTAFSLIGFSPWLAELLAGPPRYADVDATALATRLATAVPLSELEIPATAIAAFRESPGAVLETGRVLYPRFFIRGNGLASAHPWPAYAPRDFPRLGFLLLNESRHDVVLPTREVPRDFQHAADAIVLGCLVDDHIDARLVLIEDTGILYQGTSLNDPCP